MTSFLKCRFFLMLMGATSISPAVEASGDYYDKGVILTSVGGGIAFVSWLTSSGDGCDASNTDNEEEEKCYKRAETKMRTGVAIGTIMAGVGIPLIIWGKRDSKAELDSQSVHGISGIYASTDGRNIGLNLGISF